MVLVGASTPEASFLARRTPLFFFTPSLNAVQGLLHHPAKISWFSHFHSNDLF
jgi:hypothetical protein